MKDLTCCKEAEAFRDNYEAFKENNAEVIGISAQNVESHKSFASHHNLLYILLSDADNKVRRLYGVSPTLGIPGRVTFVIDKKASLNMFSLRNFISISMPRKPYRH